jgi:Fe2+ or Zn2+ uptake regulation protein
MENQDHSAWFDRIQNSGYRLTGPRKAIVELMAASQRALSPIDVYDLGRGQYAGLGLVTVYRTLDKLEELGLIQRVHQPGGCHMYIRATRGHQHILLCTGCGTAVYFSGDNLSPLVSDLSENSGYQIEDHWLQLFGKCKQCQAKKVGLEA